MGMSASQARLLAITSRINDIEFKSQQVSNIKIRLADESEQVANAYTAALNKTKITYTNYSSGTAQNIDLNSTNLATAGYKLIKRGSNGNDTAYNGTYDAATLHEMIESGEFYLVKSGVMSNFAAAEESVSGNNQLMIQSDTTSLAKAEADYNAATAKINKKEKQLDNEMKQLDTEHNALNTEFDSVKNLIGDNVEKSFNLFS